MKQRFVEFIGTFFLTFTVGLSALGNSPLAPLAIATVLAVMIYLGGHVSGGHYNPAVSLGVMLRGKLKTAAFASYVIAQSLGAAVAAFLVVYLSFSDATTSVPARDLARALIAEGIFSFALVLTVLNVATAKATSGNSFYGAAIGGVVLSGAVTVGDISGAVFNPAVAFGVSILGLLEWGHFMLYVTVQLLAGFLASIVFRMTTGD